MSEPVIEIRHRCEHGILDSHEYTYNRLVCKGGQRVRYSRQEAIDLVIGSYDIHSLTPPMSYATHAVDALLGASE